MFLDPVKLLVIGVVALVVLGPDQLPKLARMAGALRADLRRWRARLDQEVRGAFPDLPASHEIAAAVRSAMALLDRLSGESATGARTTLDAGAGDTTAGPGDATVPALTALADPWDAWPVPAGRADTRSLGASPAPAASVDGASLN